MSDLFFPQRIPLRLDGKRYSPAVTERIVAVGGASTSFAIGSKMLELLMDLKISPRTVNATTAMIGNELGQKSNEQADAYCERPLTQPATQAEPPIAIGCVEVDGGRMQTRTVGRGTGVHDPHWRENKNAGFFRMTGDRYAEDPCAALPSCFTDRKRLQGLLAGLETSGEASDEEAAEETEKPDLSWRPESFFRTCISSLCDSGRFGELMAAEADQRGFYSSDRRAFLGDGLAYNWTIQRQHFSDFVAILDFIHPIERLHETSRALYRDSEQAWQCCLKWMELCWCGDTTEVIGQMEAEQTEIGLPDDQTPDGDVCKVLAENANVFAKQRISNGLSDLPTSRFADHELSDRIASERDE